MADYPVGTLVALDSAHGPISRIVVEDHGAVISVCTEAEYLQAQSEMRAPRRVGFKKRDVIKVISASADRSVDLK